MTGDTDLTRDQVKGVNKKGGFFICLRGWPLLKRSEGDMKGFSKVVVKVHCCHILVCLIISPDGYTYIIYS